MTIRYVERLVEERNTIAAKVMAVADKAANEERQLTAEESTVTAKMTEQVKSLDAEIRTWNGTNEAFSQFQNLQAKGVEHRQAEAAAEHRTAGELFVESRAFAEYTGHGTSARMTAPWLETRAPLLSDTLGPASIAGQAVPGYPPPATGTTIWDLVRKINVSEGTVSYPVWTQGSNAAVVAEGALKPEMTISMSVVEKSLPTVAHWYQFSRQFAADKAAMQSIIDGELRLGVVRKLNADCATAITGVTTPAVTGADLLTAIRKAQASIEAQDQMADVLLINPSDAADLDLALLAATDNGAAMGAPIWGLRVVKSSKVTVGKPLVLDLDAITAYVRTGVEYFVTDSDVLPDGSSGFRKNILTALAEARALTVVQRPDLVVPAEVA